MSTPSVSIIVPNYNHSKYLEQRFASIFDQTFQDFELIILDDCSTDNSRSIIEKYRNNPKVSAIVYNETNSGSPFKQWDKGIQLAKGEYIWIAESDDTCECGFLETLMGQIHKTNNCVLAYCSTNDIDKEGNIISKKESIESVNFYTGASFVVNKLLFANYVYNASCAVFKRACVLSAHKDWINSRGAGDYYLWVFLAGFGNVCSIGKCLAYRRTHDTNITHIADSSGSNLADERKIVGYIYSRYHIASWRRIVAESLRRRRLSNERFDNEIVRKDLLSLWNYRSKMRVLTVIIAKTYYTLTKNH